ALQGLCRAALGACAERGRAGGRAPLRRGHRRPEPAVPGRGSWPQEPLRAAPGTSYLPEDLRLREGGGAGVARRRPDPRRVPHLLRTPAPRRRGGPLPPTAKGLLRQTGTPRPARLPPLRAHRRERGRSAGIYDERHRRRHGGRQEGNPRM
ncbi:MAG: hypothetical protein AVDCRST_MAG22-3773, partial [uncultured Rubrobacteraceae bacterium]